MKQLKRDWALILLAALFAAPAASAQTGGVYELTWTTLDGGGGNAAGSPYAVSATIGQNDAGILSGGAYVLEGGFWNTMTPANNPPTLGTVTPSALTSVPGIAQKLSAVYSDPDGYANLDQVSFLVNTTASVANGIRLLYDRTVNKLYLFNNAGTAFVGSCTPGAAGSLSNSRGTLNCRATTVSGSGNNLTVNWNIKPKAAFVSTTKKNLYLYARDMSNAITGWTDKGDWKIKATNLAPTLGTVTPSVLTSASGIARGFRAVYSDADGYANLKQVYFLVNTTASVANGIRLLHDRTMNKLYLYKDAGTGYVGSCTPGTAVSLSNTRGILNCAATTVNGSGMSLTVNWSITPKAAFASATKKKSLSVRT